eukprot:7209726-Pyramimonas_sp.AAC.1
MCAGARPRSSLYAPCRSRSQRAARRGSICAGHVVEGLATLRDLAEPCPRPPRWWCPPNPGGWSDGEELGRGS